MKKQSKRFPSYMETKGFGPNNSTPKNEVVLRTIIILDFFGGFNESQYFICYFVEWSVVIANQVVDPHNYEHCDGYESSNPLRVLTIVIAYNSANVLDSK